MSKDYVMQLEATIQNLRRDNALLKEENAKYKGRPKKVEDVIEWLGLDFNIIYENDTKWLYKLSISKTGFYRFKIKDKFNPYSDFTQVKDIMSMTMNQLVNLKPIDKDRSE